MKLNIDTYREIVDTLTRNKSRSVFTGLGVFWGVFMLIFLIGGGHGLKEMLAKNFEGFASNAMIVSAEQTTKAMDGFRKGRLWSMTDADLKSLRRNIPQLDVITPMCLGTTVTCTNPSATSAQLKKSVGSIKGLKADYAKVQTPDMRYGRFLNEMDERSGRKVCVISKKTYKDLFSPGVDPCGKMIKIGDVYYQVIGVDYSSLSISIGKEFEQDIVIPLSVCRKIYNYGNTVQAICATGHKGVVMSTLSPQIREVIARNHHIDPTDEQAISLFNTEELFQIMDNLFEGVNFLIWLIGIGTILAGAIGVSNIMMVSVKERTTEIGIRRAIGATPRMILSQIMTESLLLVAVAGVSGILFGVGVLQLLEMANTTNGVVNAHFQVDFWTAIIATTFLSLLGMLAGLAPAFRAMAIKPVDAMRDK